MNKLPLKKMLLSALAGILLTFAFAPFSFGYLSLLAPACFILLLFNESAKTAKYIGFSFGLGFYSTSMYWVYHSIYYFGNAHILIAILLTVLLIIYLSLYPTLCAFLTCKMKKNEHRLLVFPAIWVVNEQLISTVFTGFPWLLISYAQIDTVFSSLIPVMGEMGTSYVIIAIASYLAWTANRLNIKRLSVLVVFCIAAVFALSVLNRQAWTSLNKEPIAVTFVQGNISQDLKWNEDHVIQTLRTYYGLSKPEMATSDVIIWPEAAIPIFYHHAQKFIDALTKELAEQAHNPLLITGVPYADLDLKKIYNSLLAIQGSQHSFYHKRHLLPFGDFIPFKERLKYVSEFFNLPMSDFSQGSNDHNILYTEKLKIAPFICYEIAFSYLLQEAAHKAELLVTISNDAWFGDTSGPYQHLQIARFRSKQSGIPQIFSTNDGISAYIDHQGQIQSLIPKFEQSALNLPVYTVVGSTPWMRYGDNPWLYLCYAHWLLVALCLNNNRLRLGWQAIRRGFKPAQ